MQGMKTEWIICVKPNLGESWIAALCHCKCEPLMGKRGGSRREMCCTIHSQTNSSWGMPAGRSDTGVEKNPFVLLNCADLSCWQSNKLGYWQQLGGQLSPSSWTELIMDKMIPGAKCQSGSKAECRENGRKLGGLVVTGRDRASFCLPDERTMYYILGIKMYLYLPNCVFHVLCFHVPVLVCILDEVVMLQTLKSCEGIFFKAWTWCWVNRRLFVSLWPVVVWRVKTLFVRVCQKPVPICWTCQLTSALDLLRRLSAKQVVFSGIFPVYLSCVAATDACRPMTGLNPSLVLYMEKNYD